MFDANNNYSPPDEPTRHVLVSTKPFVDSLGAHPNFRTTIPAGTVGGVFIRGHTQIAKLGPRGSPETALIEHATAEMGEVLPMEEVNTAIATHAVKQASMKASREARRAEQG